MGIKLTYSEWLAKVHQKLIDDRAFSCVYNDIVLSTWHQAKFSPDRVARELNKRWRVKVATKVSVTKVSVGE